MLVLANQYLLNGNYKSTFISTLQVSIFNMINTNQSFYKDKQLLFEIMYEIIQLFLFEKLR